MTPEKRKELYECSIFGFIEDNFKNYKGNNEMDYINKSIAYILKYGMDFRNPTFKLQELIYTFKNQMATMVAKKQLESDPNDLTNMHSKEYDLALKFFFKDPVGFIEAKLEDDDFYNSIKPKESADFTGFAYKGYINNLDKNRKKFIELFKDKQFERASFKSKYTAFENGKVAPYDVLKTIETEIPESDHSIEKVLAKLKAGKWERRFNTTSKEYKEFKKTIDNFKNKLKPGYGDDKALEESAMRYLRHKFPKLEEGKLPTEEQIAKLSGAGKGRADFCVKVIKACRETRATQAQINKMVKGVRGLELGNLKPEYLKANAIYVKEEKVEKPEIKTDPNKPKSALRRAVNGIKTKRSVKFNLESGPQPERTKTKGGPNNVKRKPKFVEPEKKKETKVKEESKNLKPKEETKEVKPKEEVKVVKQVVDTKNFQEALKDALNEDDLTNNTTNVEKNIEMTTTIQEQNEKELS